MTRKAFAVVFSCPSPSGLLGYIDFEQKKCYFYDLECFFHHFACFFSNWMAGIWIFFYGLLLWLVEKYLQWFSATPARQNCRSTWILSKKSAIFNVFFSIFCSKIVKQVDCCHRNWRCLAQKASRDYGGLFEHDNRPYRQFHIHRPH